MANLIKDEIFKEFLQSYNGRKLDSYSQAAGLVNVNNALLEKIAGIRMDESKHGNKFEVFTPFTYRKHGAPNRTLGNYVITQNYLPLASSMVLDASRVNENYNKDSYGNVGIGYYDMKSGTPVRLPEFKPGVNSPEGFDFDINKIVQSRGGMLDIAVDMVKKATAEITGSKYVNPDKFDMTHLIAKSFGGPWLNNTFGLVVHPSVSNQQGGIMQAENAAKQFLRDPKNANKNIIYSSFPYWTNEQKSTAKKNPQYFLSYSDTKMSKPDSILTTMQVIDENGKMYQPVGWISRDDGSWKVKVGKELDYEFKKIGYEVR